MSFNDLPYEMILEIQSFLCSNKETTALKQLCKFCNETSNKYGYLKDITLDTYTSPYKFIVQYSRNVRSLESITFKCVFNPFVIFKDMKWLKHMTFQYCDLGNDSINPPLSDTETLYLSDHTLRMGDRRIKLDWSKLPKLKQIEIELYREIDLTGLQSCVELEYISIKLATPIHLPDWIADFPKLRVIQTNCFSNIPLHFKSPHLMICFIKKGVPFTSDSKLVPFRHLSQHFTPYGRFT
jgi:hypothetical protein